jgi:hypothetical protein
MESIEYTDLYPKKTQRSYCDKCSGHLILTYPDFMKKVSGVQITIRGLPTLHCRKCDERYLPERSRFAIIQAYENARKQNKSVVQIRRQKIEEDFGFTKVRFLYDPYDYYYIPGLLRQSDSGFLTPVFFNKRVLINFDHSDDYRLAFASRTYGTIYTHSDAIPFGINEYNKVIMWLGDIAKLPESEQYYLRSENVPSDHSIGSEFYDAQIECIFTDPTAEDLLVKARSEFLFTTERIFGKRLSHLDEEILQAIEEFYPPTSFTDRDKGRLTDLLNKINVESLDSRTLGELLHERNIAASGLGSLKKLQRLYEQTFSEAHIASILTPLFVTYDLRIAYAHLTSKNKSLEIMKSVTERLHVPDHADFKTIYEMLVHRLTECYEKLSTLGENVEQS